MSNRHKAHQEFTRLAGTQCLNPGADASGQFECLDLRELRARNDKLEAVCGALSEYLRLREANDWSCEAGEKLEQAEQVMIQALRATLFE